MSKLAHKSHGDTIVEVLICIAIASFVIAGSYALTDHSLQEGIAATERTEANQYAVGQIEALKLREKNSDPTIWRNEFANVLGDSDSTIKNFCLDSSAVNESANWGPVSNNGDPTVLQVQQGVAYDPVCALPAANPKYFINMTAVTDSNTDEQIYLVVVRWEPIGGGPLNQVQLYYVLPLPQASGGS